MKPLRRRAIPKPSFKLTHEKDKYVFLLKLLTVHDEEDTKVDRDRPVRKLSVSMKRWIFNGFLIRALLLKPFVVVILTIGEKSNEIGEGV